MSAHRVLAEIGQAIASHLASIPAATNGTFNLAGKGTSYCTLPAASSGLTYLLPSGLPQGTAIEFYNASGGSVTIATVSVGNAKSARFVATGLNGTQLQNWRYVVYTDIS